MKTLYKGTFIFLSGCESELENKIEENALLILKLKMYGQYVV